MDEWLGTVQFIATLSLGFLIWTVRNFLSAQIKGTAEELGAIQARVAGIDDLAAVEKRLKEVAADIELSTRRTLDVEALKRTKRIEYLERQLAEFYWPLYVRLQMDNAIWERLGKVGAESSTEDVVIARTIERQVLRPNHQKAIELIESKIHLAENDEVLEDHIFRYIRHVAVLEALRSANIKKDPVDVGEKYPRELSDRVKERAKALQHLLDAFIAAEGSPSAR
jgi:hypothetical protein